MSFKSLNFPNFKTTVLVRAARLLMSHRRLRHEVQVHGLIKRARSISSTVDRYSRYTCEVRGRQAGGGVTPSTESLPTRRAKAVEPMLSRWPKMVPEPLAEQGRRPFGCSSSEKEKRDTTPCSKSGPTTQSAPERRPRSRS